VAPQSQIQPPDWPNRDSSRLAHGPNLYAYVHNGPINSIDPLGLRDFGNYNSTFIKSQLKPTPWGTGTDYFFLGITVGAGGAGLVVFAAPAAVAGLEAAGVSSATASATVTGSLLVGGGVGGGMTIGSTVNSALNGDWSIVAYNLGNLVGGGLIGLGGGGRYISNNTGAGPTSIPVGANPFTAEAGMGYNPALGPRSGWLATAPTPASGGAAATGIAGGIGLLLHPIFTGL
jgi:hypothetical protein